MYDLYKNRFIFGCFVYSYRLKYEIRATSKAMMEVIFEDLKGN